MKNECQVPSIHWGLEDEGCREKKEGVGESEKEAGTHSIQALFCSALSTSRDMLEIKSPRRRTSQPDSARQLCPGTFKVSYVNERATCS